MNLRRKLVTLMLAGTVVLTGVGVLAAQSVSAQVDTGLQEVGQTVKLASGDPRVIAANIINVVLGLLGIVLVVLILYAGFLWMTAGGDADKVGKAKKIIVNAIIGLVIILSSWAITRYVINSLLSATQGGEGVGGGGTGGYVSGFGGSGGTSFRVTSITPQGDTPLKPRNTEVKIVFSKSVDEASASAIAIIKDGGTTVGGTIQVSGSVVTFQPSQNCPAPNDTRKCFDGDSGFQIKIGSTVKSGSGQALTCGGFAPACTAHFKTNNLVDIQPPTVNVTYPTDGMSVKVNSLIDVLANAADDSGVGMVEFFDGANSVGVDGPNASSTPLNFDAKVSWDTAGAALGAHSLSAAATDLDTNTSKSPTVAVVIRAEHCFNNQQDAGETGIDCGGDPNSQEFCGACSGGTCTSNSQCNSGFCQGGVCVEKPVIKSVDPTNGKAGTFVTLAGSNFGTTPGTVTFLGDPANPADDKVALAPQACVNLGAKVWSNYQAVVAVPDGAASGPIQIKNASSSLTDRTDQDPGPAIPNFVVDNTTHPGLCAIQPDADTVGKEVDAVGGGFGNSQGKIWFGSNDYQLSASPWSDGKAHFKIPVVNNGSYPVRVITGSGMSNAVFFDVLEKNLGEAPQLSAIDPSTGPQQEYVTLTGKNFGWTVGTVIFQGQGLEAVGDTSFPPACSANFWRDTDIVVKVPSAFKNNQPTTSGTYQVKVKRADGKESNTVDFQLDTTLQPKPGICAIEPAVGPEGTPVQLFGDRFGFDKPVTTFFPNKNAAVDSNTNQSVVTSVPKNAATGPVTIIAQGQKSNGVNFQVRNCNEAPEICGPADKFQCCASGQCKKTSETCEVVSTKAEYAWQMSTGLIPLAPYVIEQCAPDQIPAPVPSPSPWLGRAGGDQAPIDSQIMMRFSQNLEMVSAKSFHLLKCTDTGTDPCAKGTDTAFAMSWVKGSQQDVVVLKPNSKLDTNSTYLVTVSTDVKGKGETGAYMLEKTSCGKGPNDTKLGYCFRFKTRSTSEPSQIGSVGVNPNIFTFHETGVPTPYEALPLESNDKCIVLNCDLFNWSWAAGDTRGSITNDKGSNGYGKCEQNGTGNQETGDVPVDITASLVQSTLKGTGRMFVNFLPPQVVTYGPNCDAACSNALIWVKFSTALDVLSVNKSGNIVISKCKNENCNESELDPPIKPTKIQLSSDDTEVQIDHANLDPGGFYLVLLRGGPNAVDANKNNDGIKGKFGVPMSGTNHPNGFMWKFRVLQGADAFCKAERVDVLPVQKYETSVDGRQLFQATPFTKPDACDANGQKLVSIGGSVWDSGDKGVADFFKIKGDFMKTDQSKLPVGCSSNCLATGSGGVFGRMAVCGNGIIETTDSHFCKVPAGQSKGATPKGDACVLMASGAKAGEECEPSLDGLDACDVNTCLFRPVKSVNAGGMCGDGKTDVQSGETCDFGLTCVGGSQATSTTPVPEFSACNDAVTKAACENAGGDCNLHDYRGCSAGCRHLGSIAGKSNCGNGDNLGDGKDCDDGNSTEGDGCSAICLHEGSKSNTELAAICGNGILEPGETCEATLVNNVPVFPDGCDQTNCLHTGVLACTSGETQYCCGDGLMELGKDCDDGSLNGFTGCSKTCLFQGSSAYYLSAGKSLTPSFCGDGILEPGEQCEVGASSDKVAKAIDYKAAYSQSPSPSAATVLSGVLGKDYGMSLVGGLIDRTQLAYIVGTKEPDQITGLASATLTAMLMDQTGSAIYGLQCGYTDESSCKDLDENGKPRGLDNFGCCRRRPYLVKNFPISPPDVCRNVQVTLEFSDIMDPSSVVNNFEISQELIGSKCPDGTKEVATAEQLPQGVWNKVKFYWHRLMAWFTGEQASAQKWCVGGVTGQLVPLGNQNSTAKFAYNLDHALAANTTFRVRLVGDDKLEDNSDVNNRKGFKTKGGVVHAGDETWTFHTNGKICAINVITISDTTGLHPGEQPPGHQFLFINPDNKPEYRDFAAAAQSLENGSAIPLSSTEEYKWIWEPWTSSNSDLVDYSDKQPLPQGPKAEFRTKISGSSQLNGTAILTAGIKITNDTINVPSSNSSTVYGTAQVAVLACENPWPSLSDAPFQDTLDWHNNALAHGKAVSNLASNVFTLPPTSFFNFSTMYCRDAGEAHKQGDDLPALTINPVPRTTADQANGILRQYLFTYGDDRSDLKTDGIGIRIAENPQHLSPAEWYTSKGFFGNPKSVTIDGFPALQDEGTLYIAAANQPNIAGSIYSNIYVISHNPDAKPETLAIYDQMVKYLAFNVNILGQSNTCHELGNIGSQYQTSDVFLVNNLPVKCSADFECVGLGAKKQLYCDSNKAKMGRDTVRMADFQTIIRRLATNPGNYPQMTSGSYIKGLTNSIWSSWKGELGKNGTATLPVDPVNRFVTCGKCENGTSCMNDKECAGQATTTCMGGSLVGGSWTKNADIDPATCWNSKTFQYICPAYDVKNQFSVSRLYQYKSFAGGTQYELSSEFEVRPLTAQQTDWWYPKLNELMYACANNGKFCADTNGNPSDALCRSCSTPGSCKYCKSNTSLDCTTDAGVCPKNDCIDVPVVAGTCRPFGGSFKYSGICNNQAMAEKGICGDGVLNNGEQCELGDTKSATCKTANNENGHQLKSCTACTKYDIDPKHPQCIADVKCGNGRIDKNCSNDATLGCNVDSDCSSGGTCKAAEVCDDGVLNGAYGHCATNCQGYGGYCGNGQMDAGETCDNGADNGKWSSSKNPATCSFDCKGIGPYCGDQTVNGTEECDGTVQTSPGALCVGTSTLCDTDADCPTNVKCGSTATITMGTWSSALLGTLAFTGRNIAASVLDHLLIPSVSAAPFPKTTLQISDATLSSIIEANKTKNIIKTVKPLVQVLGNVNLGSSSIQNMLQNVLINPIPVTPNNSCGGVNTMSALTYDDGKKHSVFASCDGLTYTGTDKIKRATQHIRTCKVPASSGACSWNCWSECTPVGMCGDGVLDQGEACDDGSNNGDSKPCLKTCQKNMCGDGFLNAGVEECDNGLQNGSATCNADYNSSCLSCSQSCKWLASAGGYCGDGLKNGPEQCDGKSGLLTNGDDANSRVTCQQLGYDYASSTDAVATSKGWATCANSCQFGGCQKCSEVIGNGVVKGRVYDAVFQRVVAGARVSLMYKGVKIEEVMSDGDGVFIFNSLNKKAECNSYKLVIDMYQDNPCTNVDKLGTSCYEGFTPPYTYPYSIDESASGGYFPFTSDIFSQSGFDSIANGKDGDGVNHFDIFPRPEYGMAYVAILWKPQGLGYKLHTVLPQSMAFTMNNWGLGEKSITCDYQNGPVDYPGKDGTYPAVCIRDLNSRATGDWDTQSLPYSRLICLHRVGEKSTVWSDNRYNGCPVEGFEQCLENLKAKGINKTVQGCRQSVNDADCTSCGIDSYHYDATNAGLASRGYTTCSDKPDFANCMIDSQFGPMTNLTNLVPMGQSGGVVKYMFSSGPGNSGQAKQIMTGSGWNTRAYVAITSIGGTSEIQTVEKPSGSGWAWYIGDIDPKTFAFNKKNVLTGSDLDEANIASGIPNSAKTGDLEGIGAWSYWFQGSGNGSFCIPNSIPESKDADPNTWKLNTNVGLCNGAADETKCQQQSSSCKTWALKAYNKYVW